VSALPWEQQLILVFRHYSKRLLAEAAEDQGVSREHALSPQRTLCARGMMPARRGIRVRLRPSAQ
jgi:hypothetical protein